jgi:hypothetical protein
MMKAGGDFLALIAIGAANSNGVISSVLVAGAAISCVSVSIDPPRWRDSDAEFRGPSLQIKFFRDSFQAQRSVEEPTVSGEMRSWGRS